MLKIYQPSTHKGDTPELWEENWATNDFEQALRFCEVDPLRPLFEKYATPNAIMLEGGCGNGQYVAFLASRGVQTIGLDFAQTTLKRLHSRKSDLRLCVGDVAALPFQNEVFDLYYSGGVVEHFESGPEPALREARRVMRAGGVFLVSVPYLNLVRRFMSPFRSGVWKNLRREEVQGSPEDEFAFFQYVYSRSEFEQRLKQTGWRVIATQGYAVLWGLYDAPYLQKLVERVLAGGFGSSAQSNGASAASSLRNGEEDKTPLPGAKPSHNSPSVMRRLVVSEDDTVPVAGLAVRLMRHVSANMMMYVCVPA